MAVDEPPLTAQAGRPQAAATKRPTWARVEFLSKTRHDLRTPLNAVLGYGEILLEDAEADGHALLAMRIERLRSEGSAILVRIDALLDATRLETAGVPVSREALARLVNQELGAPASALAATADELADAVRDEGVEAALSDVERIQFAARSLEELVHRGAAPIPTNELRSGLPSPADSGAPLSASWSLPGSLLVVDDNELNRDLLSRTLDRLGHTVAVAEGGRQALEMLEAGDYDIVLLDLMMPEMDGFQVLDRIKADERLRHVRVIMLSALNETDNVARGLEMGADDYLVKPFNPVLLRARIGACLDRKRFREREQEHLRKLAEAREVEHRRKTAELEFARKLQLSMLPSGDIRTERIELVGRMTSATEVGGDYYDFGQLDSGRIFVAVGDATGHGVAAGIMVGMTKMGLLTGLQSHDDFGSLGRLVEELNSGLKRCTTQRGIGMALALAVIEPETMKVAVSSNGLPSPLYYSAAEDTITSLGLQAPPLGFLKTVPVPTREIALSPGDALMFLTDGFHERFDADGEQWGYDTVERELLGICRTESDADSIARRVINACADFAGDTEADDDMTVVVVRAT